MSHLYLTKTDYIHYLRCPSSLWLLKHKPDVYPHREFSAFLRQIAAEGYEVERYAQRLFPNGIPLPAGTAAGERTRQAVAAGTPIMFQATFHTDDGMFIRSDVLELHGDACSIYEIKSSAKVKREKQHDHIKDLCFQVIALEKSGLSVRDAYIIHVNADYVRDGEVNPAALLKKMCVTDAVRDAEAETEVEVSNALALLRETAISENGCPCYRKTRANHCDAFAYFNGAPERQSVWELGRISEKKLVTLLDRGVTHLREIPEDIDLNPKQRRQALSAVRGEPVVYEERIAEMLGTLTFPLYFFDYETAAHAVPRLVGFRPWQHIPFQYSLHILHEDGTLDHREQVSETLTGVEEVLSALCGDIAPDGDVISWHASFEQCRNREMGEIFPRYREQLTDINRRMFDLEDVFREAYADAAFRGSTSIKKVLPVLCPHLTYADMAVQDGAQAMGQWLTMVDPATDGATKADIRRDLLTYCTLDTYAMVELYRTLRAMVS